MRKCAILVITHIPYSFPDKPCYIPLQVGSGDVIESVSLRDNTGENISDRNSTFCELTGLYWAWKNLDASIIGLVHYRRYLGAPKLPLLRFLKAKRGKGNNLILSAGQAERMLETVDLILPKKRHYWIETRGQQYVHAHHMADLEATGGVLREHYPSYLRAWHHMLSSRSGHICNMFVMRKDLLDSYCTWLFDVLFAVEERLDISSYGRNDRRVFGFLSERLLDVWIETNQLKYREVPLINTESQHWLRKGSSFVKRKFVHHGRQFMRVQEKQRMY